MLWLHFVMRVIPLSVLAMAATLLGMLALPQERLAGLAIDLYIFSVNLALAAYLLLAVVM